MQKVLIFLLLGLSTWSASAQITNVSHNKPLAFFNPSLQNYTSDSSTGTASLSLIPSPFLEQKNPANYLALGELRVNPDFVIGVYSGKTENRLNVTGYTKLYLSYRFEMEKGTYLIFGADLGRYKDVLKPADFNQVYAPNKFVYADTVSTGMDVGFGVTYAYDGLQVGLGFSKLNKPAVYDFPVPIYYNADTTHPDSLDIQLYDTTINSTGQGKFGIQNNLNAVYRWSLNQNVDFTHSLHLSNIDLAGIDYIGFQNFVHLNQRHSAGLGVFFNGYPGYFVSAGYGINSSILAEVSAFFTEDFNFDSATNKYVNSGFKPTLEFNVRYKF